MKMDFEKYQIVINLIRKAVENTQPTSENIKNTVRDVCVEMVPGHVKYGLLPEELTVGDSLEKFVDAFSSWYADTVGVRVLCGEPLTKSGIKPWVEKALKSGELKWVSWENYKKVLWSQYNMTPSSIDAIDKISTDVLDRMGNPRRDGEFRSQGLLMGEVQSGKTATYTAICHKAADAGYRLIIVLTGMIESLREQTQKRLDKDFAGISIDSKGRQGSVREILTGRGWTVNRITTPQNDFKSTKSDASIAPENSSQVSILVIKKNARILNNLLEWFKKTLANVNVSGIPCLVIDDEADNASINTKPKRDDNACLVIADEADNASINTKPKRDDIATINLQIRELLDFFRQVSFLAVTATPFANVFIDPQIDPLTGEEKVDQLPDLFPRDYILCLPPPEGYLGVERLFGESAEIPGESFKYRCVIPLPDREEKIRGDDVVEVLPCELRKAVLYFACACTYEDLGMLKNNMSMMVHIARYVQVQGQLAEKINDLIKEVREFTDVNEGRPLDSVRQRPLYKELCELWNEGTGEEYWYIDPTQGSRPPSFRDLSSLPWERVWKKRFGQAVKKIQVLAINSQSEDRDLVARYETHDARVIAVGGDALSRGLTLQGLCVSYFERAATAYDTLLQMGRWFGYHKSHAQYMRIWISDGLVSSYRYIAEALKEFRQLLNSMRMQGREPRNFGLKIKLAPKNSQVRLITAPNKSRTAKKICTDVAGYVCQSGALPFDEKALSENTEAIRRFVEVLGKTTNDKTQDMVWSGVDGHLVADLLEKFKVVAWSNNVVITNVADKIREKYDGWNVRLISADDDGEYDRPRDLFGDGRIINCTARTYRKIVRDDISWVQPRNKGILSQNHFKRGLSDAALKELKRQSEASDERVGCSTLVLRLPEAKPTLLIYPILTIKREELADCWTCPDPVFNLVFGLPAEKDFGTSTVVMDYSKEFYMANILQLAERATFPE